MLEGRVAIVTGAADGPKASLGATFARRLASEGAHVLALDILDTASIVGSIEAEGGQATGFDVDLADPAAVAACAKAIADRFGRIDILINNAALGSNSPPVPIADMSVEIWDATMAVNVRGLLLMVQAVVPAMAAQGYGKIVNLGSPMVQDGAGRRIHYLAAKGAVHAMTRAMARELGADGIRVNTLTPGYPLTPFNRAALDRNPAFEEKLLAGRSIPAHVTAEDIANVLAFLVSPASDAVTGQHLIVDNGTNFL